MPKSGKEINMAFTLKEKRQHYTDVANGTKPVKQSDKFTESEQRAYARGQRDARNENARIYASQHATPEEKESWALRRAQAKVAYLEAKKAEKEAKKQAKKTK